MKSDNLPSRVELWSLDGQSLVETLCACGNFYLAKAAFERAVSQYPNARIMLCDRIADYSGKQAGFGGLSGNRMGIRVGTRDIEEKYTV